VFVRLLLLFTVVPLVELVLLVQLGRVIGLWATVTIVIATGVIGAWLTRLEGLRTLARVREDMAAGRMPAEALVDGVLILAAGAVLLTPGMITDACGFFLLIPAGRAIVRRSVLEGVRRRIGRPEVIDAEWHREGDHRGGSDVV
jgi:UPF0716 protein FxsA